MFSIIAKINPFKKTLTGILSAFHSCVDDLRTLAAEKAEEAAAKEAEAHRLMAEVEACETEAEEALNAADSIERMIDGSPVIYAASERLV